jgi:hypothetical protein
VVLAEPLAPYETAHLVDPFRAVVTDVELAQPQLRRSNGREGGVQAEIIRAPDDLEFRRVLRALTGACASKNRRGASRTGLRREFVPTMESPRNIERKVRFHSELFRLASPPVPAPAPSAKAKAGRRKMAAAPSHFAFRRILLGLRLSACKTPAQERASHTLGGLDLIVPGRRPHDPAINRVFTFCSAQADR